MGVSCWRGARPRLAVSAVSTAVASVTGLSGEIPRPPSKARSAPSTASLGCFSASRLRSVMSILLAAWVLLSVAGCWLVRSQPSEPTPAHASVTSLSREFAISAEPAAGDCAMSPACPQSLAMAVLPPSATVLVALEAAVVVTAIGGSVAHRAAPATRGPLCSVVALTGKDILTRFCLARR